MAKAPDFSAFNAALAGTPEEDKFAAFKAAKANPIAARRARVQTNKLARTGLTGPEVKRRAAANEPIVQEGPRNPTAGQSFATGVAEVVGGAAEALGQTVAVPADLLATVFRPRGSKEPLFPRTALASEAADDLRDRIRGAFGVDSDVATNEAVGMVNRFAGQALVPLPEATIGRQALAATKAGSEAAEAALRRETQGVALADNVAPPVAASVADDATEAAARSEAGVSGNTVRLYRAEPVDPAVDLPSYDMTSTPDVDPVARAQVRGSWYTADRKQAIGYKDDIQGLGHDAQIRTVDVPAGEVDNYLAAKHPTASNFATDLDKDYFLPPEARAGSTIESTPKPTNLADELEAQILSLEDRAAKLFQQADNAPDAATRTQLETEAYALADESDALLKQRNEALAAQAGDAQATAREPSPMGVRAPEQMEPDFVADELARKRADAEVLPTEPVAGMVNAGRSQVVAERIRNGNVPTAPPATPPPIIRPPSAAGPTASIPSQASQVSEAITKAREFVEDDWIRVKNLMRKPGVKVTEGGDPYLAEILMHGRLGARVEDAKRILTDIDTDIVTTAKATGVDNAVLGREVDDYLKARHAPERNAHLGPRAAGMSDQEAQAIMDAVEASPHGAEVKRVAERYQDLNNQTLDVLLESEVIDADLHALLRDRYKHHVPLNRIMDDTEDIGEILSTRPLDVRSSGLFRATGSEREVSDIATNIATNYQQALLRAEKNRLDLATDTFASNNPQLGLFTEVKPRAIGKRFLVKGEENKRFIMEQMNDPQVLTFRKEGKTKHLRINDPQLAIVMRGLGRVKLDGIWKPVNWVARTMSSLATRYNPEFFLPNKVRDIQEAMIYAASKGELGAKSAVKIPFREKKSVMAIIDWHRGIDSEGARGYQRMRLSGGTTGGMGLSTRKQVTVDIENIRRVNRSNPRRAARKLFEYIDNLNAVFEDSTRLDVFNEAISRGLSDDAAARLAKEASINFNKMGRGGPQINALYMFANASIQGSAKTLRAMKNPKVGIPVALSTFAAVGATNSWNDNMDPDWRTKVSKYDRLSSLPVVLPPSDDGSFNYLTIPVSWGLKPIKVTADYAYDLTTGQDVTPGEAVAGSVGAVVDAYNPAGGTDLGSSLTPTILDLPVDIMRNRKWSGTMIRPEFDRTAPASQKYFRNLGESATGSLAIGASEQLSDRGIEVSPADIKYSYETLIGGTGRFGSKVFNTVAAIGQGEAPKVGDVPVVSRIVRQVDAGSLAQRRAAIQKEKAEKRAKAERARAARAARAARP